VIILSSRKYFCFSSERLENINRGDLGLKIATDLKRESSFDTKE
jgi:hypothetical protein